MMMGGAGHAMLRMRSPGGEGVGLGGAPPSRFEWSGVLAMLLRVMENIIANPCTAMKNAQPTVYGHGLVWSVSRRGHGLGLSCGPSNTCSVDAVAWCEALHSYPFYMTVQLQFHSWVELHAAEMS